MQRDATGLEVPVEYFTLDDMYPRVYGIYKIKQKPHPFYIKALQSYDFYYFQKGTTPAVCPDGLFYAVTTRPFDRGGAPLSVTSKVKLSPVIRHVIFCKLGFSPAPGRHSFKSLSDAVLPLNYPTGSPTAQKERNIEKFLTISSTLYHELYYLTDAPGKTHDKYSKWIFLEFIINL